MKTKGEIMVLVNIEALKEVRICFDWERMLIPKEYVKHLSYEVVSDDQNGLWCSEIEFTCDLEYLQTNGYYTGNNIEYYQENHITSNSSCTMYERLEKKDVWFLELIYLDGSSLEVNPPTNRKDYYSSTKQYITAWDAPNACEIHKIKENLLHIKWQDTKEDMKEEEIKVFLKKGYFGKGERKRDSFGLYLFKEVLKKHFKEEEGFPFDEEKWGDLVSNKFFSYVPLTLNKKVVTHRVGYVFCFEKRYQEEVFKLMQDHTEVSNWVVIGRNQNFSSAAIFPVTFEEFNKFWLEYKEENDML